MVGTISDHGHVTTPADPTEPSRNPFAGIEKLGDQGPFALLRAKILAAQRDSTDDAMAQLHADHLASMPILPESRTAAAAEQMNKNIAVLVQAAADAQAREGDILWWAKATFFATIVLGLIGLVVAIVK